jgi:cytidylate kinase
MSDLKVQHRVTRPTTTTGPHETGTVTSTTPNVTAATSSTPATTTPVAALFQAGETPVGQHGRQQGTLRPHEALMTSKTTAKPKHESFAAAFASVMGKDALRNLQSAMGHKPIVLIAGDQCTGKGTAAEGLVQALGGANTGTGTVLRALAKENGVSIEQMSAMLSGKSVDIVDEVKHPGQTRTVSLKDFPHLGTAEDVDVRLDYRAATAIASSSLTKADGQTIDISVFESRLAGHLGQFLEGLGRENIISVYLYAAPRVQAERYLEREVFAPQQKAGVDVTAARAQAKGVLAALGDTLPLGDCLQALVDAKVPGLDALAAKVKGIAGRDENDKTRLLSLYGVDYQDRSAFDVVVDTNGKTPDEVKAAILAAVQQKTQQA